MEKIDPKSIENILALTPLQEGMLFHYLQDPKNALYFEQLCLEVFGEINVSYFEKAWQTVIATNEMLRTVFRWEKLEKSSQIILRQHKCNLVFYDLTKKDSHQAKTVLAEIKRKDRCKRFDLSEVPFRVILCKLDEKKYEMIISNHHILYDGWSNGIILKEFFKAYHELGQGGELLKLPVKPSFKEFLKWTHNQAKNEQEKFWRAYLNGFETPTELPIKNKIIEETARVDDYSIILAEDTGRNLDIFVKNNHVTLATVFYAAWGILLQKYCGSEDVIFGTTVSGRSAGIKGIENIVGLFINTIPLRTQTTPHETLSDIVFRIDKVLQSREEVEHTSLVDIRNYCSLGGNESLFDTIVVIENYPLDNRLLPENSLLSVNSYAIAEMTHYDLTVGIMLFNQIEVKFSFHPGFFDKETIESLAGHYKGIIQNIIENPGTSLSQLEIISTVEKNRILYEFNNTAVQYPEYKSIHQLLAEQIAKIPDKIALISSLHHYMTYKSLNDAAGYLGRVLKNKGVGPNCIVGLLIERSLEMIIGVLGILKAGGAYLPIEMDYPPERICYMLENSQTRLFVTQTKFAGAFNFSGEIVNIENVGLTHIDKVKIIETEVTDYPQDIVYMIYTSGSTGKPKGVIIQKEGFLNLLRWYMEALDIRKEDNNLLIAPISFDLAQKNLFGPFLAGGRLTLASPGIPDYIELKKLIHKMHVTMINCAPSVFYPLVEPGDDSDFAQLHSLRAIILGGELIRKDKLLPWLASVSFHCEIINTYGPTECTDIATFYRIPGQSFYSQEIIPIGRPIAHVKVYVLDKYLQVLPVKIPGELCIGGIGLSQGYYHNKKLTEEKFAIAPHLPDKKIYRTGDLTRWLPDGNIEFLGRIDHQVKIRGFRIELGEIESELVKHEEVKEAVVVSRQSEEGENYLCAYIVPRAERRVSISVLREYLGQQLPDYMVPSYFVYLERIPLTPSGKIDRRGLPAPGIKKEKNYVAPRNRIEEELVEIWCRILDIKLLPNAVGIDDNFFQLGGHSLKATSLSSRIHKEFNVKIPLGEIFKRPTIRKLFDYINKAVGEKYTSLEPVEEKEYYKLSSAQKRLYFLQQMDTAGTAYNISAAWVLEGNIEKLRLEQSFAKLIQRHEGFRSSFIIAGEEPVQKIHTHVAFEIDKSFVFPCGGGPLIEFIRPFDLSKAPLLRVGLIEIEKDRYIFLVDMHHIISDGISTQVLIDEFSALYTGKKLPEIKLQYKDYAEWQNREKVSKKSLGHKEYWQKEYEGEIPVLELPTDYMRPAVQGFEGNSINLELGSKTTGALKTLALETTSTLYIMLLAIYNIFLSRLSSREDIVIGSPVAGRKHADLEKIIGMFVNTLPLRNYPSSEKIFLDFLHEVKERSLEAFENQEYQYEDMVNEFSIKRDSWRNPLFDTMFVLQNTGSQKINLPGLNLVPYEFKNKTSKFDLTLIVVEEEEKLHLTFEYNIKLFKEATVKRFTAYLIHIMQGVLENFRKRISDFEIITEEEKRQILFDFNDTKREYPVDQSIHRLFAEQVAKVPDHIAVFSHGRTLCWTNTDKNIPTAFTYRELNEQSGRLAYILNEKGVMADDIVAIMMKRSIELITGILGILKAGGAYMPIDLEYPQERIDYMLKESGTRILINKSEIRNPKSETNSNDKNTNDQNKNFGDLIILDFEHLNSDIVSNFEFRASNLISSNLAYVIYTSGSTGKPKGVLVSHRNVVRLVKNTNFVPLNRETRILQTGAPVFDATTLEIWGSLLNGGQLVLTDKETILDAHRLAGTLRGNHINTFWLSSSLFNQLTQENIELFSSLKYLLVGGDVLSPAHVNRVKRRFPGLSIINGYGPTENTTFSTTYLIAEEFEQNIPIGSPIANSTTYIIDRYGHLQPVGIYGELAVGGDGIALGYLNNPELTTERFVNFHHSKLYCTGDLVRWNENGIIEFLGRLDHQVKIRGFRVELGEIESYLLKFGKIKEAVVIPVGGALGDKTLAAYVVPDSEISFAVNELREYLQTVLPGYMIPAYIVVMEKLPLTLNGKIDRRLLPVPGLNIGEKYVAPRDEAEKRVASIWSEILGVRQEIIGIEDNFFELGGQSLKATLMASRIQREFKVTLPLAEIFKRPTVKGLTEFIRKTITGVFMPVEMALRRDYYALSASQRRMYLLYRLDENSTAYNMPIVLSLAGKLEISRFEAVIRKLIQRHEGFRTSFELLNEEAVQKVHENVAFEIELLGELLGDRQEKNSSFIIRHFIRAFDLSKAPLLRVGLLKQEEDKYLLMVDMHHIISDGMSLGIFVREFMALYVDKDLPALGLQYKDYAQWQQSEGVREILKSQEQYWLEQFETEIPVLNLPTDFVRPKVQSFEGRSIACEIGPGETMQLQKLALEQNTTLYMVLLAVFGIFLAKLSGQEDIVMGTPTAGRRHVELESIIGMFVNTLALRHFPQGEKSFAQFLGEVTGRTLAAFENQDYPFEDLVEKVVQNRDMGRNPIFDVMFAWQNIEIPDIAVPGLKLTPYHYESGTAKFDITLNGIENGDGLHFDFEYGSKLFEEITIRRFINFFKKIITIVPANPAVKLAALEIISEEERQQVLVEFNDTDKTYPAYKDISVLFEEQAEKTPDRIALIVAAKGEEKNVGADLCVCPVSLTYRQLNEQSGLLAGLLIEKGVLPDNIVGLMIDRSIEMMVGLLGILKSGAAYLPIAPEYPEERIDYMLKDSHAKILIINKSEIRNSKLETNSNKTNSNDPNKNFEDMMVLDFKHLNLISQKGCPRRGLHHSKLAYIIYTSGSTGKPKGVIVQKEGFLNLLHWYIEELNITKEDNHLLIAPISFDLAQKNLFSPFLAGGCLTLAPAGIPDYRELTGIIHKSHITMINCAPSVFYPLVEINHDTGFTPLHSLRAVVLGGEPIRFDRLLPWVKTDCYHCELINTYGPTECTDIATSYRIPVKPFYPQEAIPIGRPISNVKVYILDKNLQILPVKIPGELCIGGIGLGQGYYNNKQLTGEKFIVVPHLPEKNVYRTGDLSRWLADGNIEFLGRIDHQVKIRGFRIELGEIENELLKHEEIKEAVVITRQGETGENYLCAYIVPRTERQIAISILREYLVHRLPDYMVPAYFVYLDAIPLTPSGKINRRGLPEPETRIEHYAAPRDQMETQLVKMWCDVLDNKNSSIAIGIDDNFFQLGGHSLKATILITKIHKTFDVKVPLSEVFKTPRIRELSGYIKNAVKWKYEQVELVEKKEYYVLSSAQKRLYFLYQVAPGDTGYNMPSAMLLEGDIEIQKLEEIFKHLIMIHESLRTTFHMIENEPAQRVHREVEFVVESKVFTGQSRPPEAIIKNFIRPFDLSEAPLLRAGLITLSEKEHILMIDIHHIAADGISMGVILNGFITLLNGGTLPGPKITYKDYVYRQYKQMAAGAFKKQETFWLQEFGDAIPVLNLPTDFSRPVVQSLEGDIQGFEINPLETGQLKRLCLERECSLFMGLLAIFNVFLGRLADQEDIVVGCIAAGRLSNELQNVVGMFVNTLPIRSYPYGEKTFSQFLPEVKEKTLAVFENQEYQFEELVEILPTKRDTGRNPLFDAALDVQETVFDFNKQSINLQGVKMKPYPYTHSAAKFDLVCHCENVGDRLLFTIEYACKLFKKNTIQRFCDYFQKILSQVIQQPGTLISEIDILSENEKKEILTDLNGHIDLFNVYPGHTIQRLFEAEVEKAPDHIALVGAAPRGCPDLSGHLVCLSYRELNEKSNRLAWSLRKKGIKPDHIVGIMMGPGIEMITTIFSVLKAGGIYLPVDPGYPAERAKFMLADCVAKCLLTTTEGAEPGPDQESKENPSCTNRPCDGAYVIFTSGTTGKPKGVMVEHRNIIALMKAGRELFGYCSRDVWTMFHSFCFDFSVWEMYGPLLHGGKLVTVPRLIAHEPQRYLEILKMETVTILNQTPTVFYQLVQEEMQAPGKSLHLRYVIFGGEALKPGKLKPWKDKYPGTKLINMYGITETTVHVTFKEISGAEIEQNISNIGKPLPTLSGYIVNKYLKLQPKTVPGELLVGGHGVTRGYLNRPELTGEKFGRDFHHSSFIHHSKLYRTGDRVRLIDNGEMEYLGRIDHQVKVRGNRVETGEIERQMMLLPWIEEALVIPKEDDHGNNYLCAYMKVEPGKNITVTELRETLLKKLPDYMIPSYFIPLEVFPVTTTGKIDREKLPEPGSMRTRIGVTYAAPVTETEKTVAAVWQEVLKLDRVGIHDNFFDLGGTSLDIVRLNARLKGVFNLEIPVLDLFEYPTIQAFSRRLEPGQAGAGDAAEEKAPGFNVRIEKGKDKMKDRRQRLKIGMQ